MPNKRYAAEVQKLLQWYNPYLRLHRNYPQSVFRILQKFTEDLQVVYEVVYGKKAYEACKADFWSAHKKALDKAGELEEFQRTIKKGSRHIFPTVFMLRDF
jgi:hypothetical protein